MPSLPKNLVKPHVSLFDNPLRRTDQREAPPVPNAMDDESGVVIQITTNATTNTSDNEQSASPPRITVRIDDAIRRALEAECFKRRVGGEKTNVAEIARGILSDWAASR